MAKHIKILHARVVAGPGGGPDKTIMRSARHIDPARYQLAAAYLHPADDTRIDVLRGAAGRCGMPIYTIPERGPIDWRAIRLMRDLCEKLHIDIWHGHDYKTDLLGRLIQYTYPMKLVTTMHGFTGETWRTKLYAKMSHAALRKYDRVLVVSPPLMRYAAEHGVDPEKLCYIPNGIDLEEFKRAQPPEQAKAALELKQDEHAIVVVCRFSTEKGVDRAIHLFAKLRQSRSDLRLHLVGDGPQRHALESLAHQLGLMPHIQWWGWQKDTRPILEAMDTLILPSYTEGLPNVILEAMALGVPVAATSVGAVPDVLAHGESGVMLLDDEDRWAQQVMPLLSEPLLRARLIGTASARIKERHDFVKRMQRVQAVYDELVPPSALASKPLQLAA